MGESDGMVSGPHLTKRDLLCAAAALPLAQLTLDNPSQAAAPNAKAPASQGADMSAQDIASLDLPAGVRSRMVAGINGLDMHVLEAGFEAKGRPAVLLLHGFPDLAYSWRRTMLPLAEAGYHVIAPDQRGYGLTTGWDAGDVASFRTHAYALDAMRVVFALGHRSVAAVVGHDFGSMVAAYGALVRPDVFRSLVMVSFPFDGPPAIRFDDAGRAPPSPGPTLAAQLAALPRPRKDSMAFFASPGADADMRDPPQGLHDFLRAYFHVKSADWPGNHPHPLASGTAAELATLPTYYIMDEALGMAATVAPDAPSPVQVAANTWLPDAELDVYVRAFRRTGFQGALNWFRCHTGPIGRMEIELFSGKAIDVPALFVSGIADWGTYRKPGALERMRTTTCPKMTGVELIEGAGHWVQQEQPGRFNAALVGFLHRPDVTR